MPWDPDRYHQFQTERAAPFDDLLRLVNVRPGLEVIDLGCGSGELTRRLADHLPESSVLGLDSSVEMLQKTAPYARPSLRFARGRIEDAAGDWDLIFSNAAIQWVDDHPALIARLLAMLRPGGQLAVQMPSNHNHPTHQLILQVAQEEPFYSALGGWVRRSPVLPVDDYAGLLYRHGGRDLVLFEKVYPHILSDADALADWTSGTALVPYYERLEPGLKDRFMERYRSELRRRFPEKPVFYPFRRILFTASRPDQSY